MNVTITREVIERCVSAREAMTAKMRASSSIAIQLLTPELAAPLLASAPVFPNRCACGEEVTPDRLRDSWIFYCQSCGANWSSPAPREPVKRKPRPAVKRCVCAKTCRFCGGAR